jgi:hypothetical protein
VILGLGFFGLLSLRLRMFLSSVYQKTLQWPNCFRFFSKHLIMFSNKWSNTLHEGKSTGLCEHSCKLDDRVWVCQGFTPWIPPWTSFLGTLLGWSHIVCLCFYWDFLKLWSDNFLAWMSVWQLVLKWIPFNRYTALPFVICIFLPFLKAWFQINQFCFLIRLFAMILCVSAFLKPWFVLKTILLWFLTCFFGGYCKSGFTN